MAYSETLIKEAGVLAKQVGKGGLKQELQILENGVLSEGAQQKMEELLTKVSGGHLLDDTEHMKLEGIIKKANGASKQNPSLQKLSAFMESHGTSIEEHAAQVTDIGATVPTAEQVRGGLTLGNDLSIGTSETVILGDSEKAWGISQPIKLGPETAIPNGRFTAGTQMPAQNLGFNNKGPGRAPAGLGV